MQEQHQAQWLIDHADPHEPFERACARELRRLYDQNVQMRAVLMKHIALYRVDDDAYDPRAEVQRIYELEMGVHA
jgi:hypothetical protein